MAIWPLAAARSFLTFTMSPRRERAQMGTYAQYNNRIRHMTTVRAARDSKIHFNALATREGSSGLRLWLRSFGFIVLAKVASNLVNTPFKERQDRVVSQTRAALTVK